MTKPNDITQEKEYRSYPINNGEKKNFSCYKRTLDQVIDQVEYSLTKHSKTLFTRLDIRNDSDSEKTITRKDMTRIAENTKRAIERKYKASPNKPDMNITWAAENDGDKPHFHLFVSVNGNAIQNAYAIHDAVNQVVKKHLGTEKDGLVEYCKSNNKYGKMVDRNSTDFHQQMDESVYMGSYLAKTHTKENKPKGARVSSTSRVPQDWRESPTYQEIMNRKNPAIEADNYTQNTTEPEVNEELQQFNEAFSAYQMEEEIYPEPDEFDYDEYYKKLAAEKAEREEDIEALLMRERQRWIPKEVLEARERDKRQREARGERVILPYS